MKMNETFAKAIFDLIEKQTGKKFEVSVKKSKAVGELDFYGSKLTVTCEFENDGDAIDSSRFCIKLGDDEFCGLSFDEASDKLHDIFDFKAGWFVCEICGKLTKGYTNNASPVIEGVCCDKCNEKVVIPARLSMIAEEFEDER